MQRFGGAPGVAALILLGACGPNDAPRDRCRLEPTFVVTLATDQGTFPEDTRLAFTHGSGTEHFALAAEHPRQVVFCETTPPLQTPESAGAGGTHAHDPAGVEEIVCDLWTGGPTALSVFASGFDPIEDHLLETNSELCTVVEVIELETERPARPGGT